MPNQCTAVKAARFTTMASPEATTGSRNPHPGRTMGVNCSMPATLEHLRGSHSTEARFSNCQPDILGALSQVAWSRLSEDERPRATEGHQPDHINS